MKVSVKRAFKSYSFFVTKKTNKKAAWLWNKISSTPIQMCRGTLIPFQNQGPLFLLPPLFFEEYLNLQVRINKMVNKISVNYHPSPSELTSWIHFLKFYWLSMTLSLQNICWIFSETCIFHHVFHPVFR